MYWRRIGNVLGEFGANRVHFGSILGKLALTKLHKYGRIV